MADNYEIQLLSEERSKLLKVAEEQEKQLGYANMMIEKLTLEKEELTTRALFSRLNKMRDEMDEKSRELNKVKKENSMLTEAIENFSRKNGNDALTANWSEEKAGMQQQIEELQGQLNEKGASGRGSRVSEDS